MWVVADVTSGELLVSFWMSREDAEFLAASMRRYGGSDGARAERLDALGTGPAGGAPEQQELPMDLSPRRLDPRDYLGESGEERLARTGSWWDREGATPVMRPDGSEG